MTAPTLPAMTEHELYALWCECWGVFLTDETKAFGFAKRAMAARDAQWAARHNAWVDGIDKAMAAEVDKLQSEIENLHSVMVAAAEEIHEHWQSHCDEEGYGPANLMRRLEKGIPAEYAYKAGDFERLMQERDAAVARLDAAVRGEREACATLCDDRAAMYLSGPRTEKAAEAIDCAIYIRARTKD